jgi:hypothetical protein
MSQPQLGAVVDILLNLDDLGLDLTYCHSCGRFFDEEECMPLWDDSRDSLYALDAWDYWMCDGLAAGMCPVCYEATYPDKRWST